MMHHHPACCRGDNTQATQLLAELNFLPTEVFRLQRCTESVASLHPAIAPRLPILLLAAANALAGTGQVRFFQIVLNEPYQVTESFCYFWLLLQGLIVMIVLQVAQLRTLVAFAGNLPQRISQGTFQQLNEIYNAM